MAPNWFIDSFESISKIGLIPLWPNQIEILFWFSNIHIYLSIYPFIPHNFIYTHTHYIVYLCNCTNVHLNVANNRNNAHRFRDWMKLNWNSTWFVRHWILRETWTSRRRNHVNLPYTQVETIDYMQYLIIKKGTLQIAIRKWWLNINGEIVERKSIGFDSLQQTSVQNYVEELEEEEEGENRRIVHQFKIHWQIKRDVRMSNLIFPLYVSNFPLHEKVMRGFK